MTKNDVDKVVIPEDPYSKTLYALFDILERIKQEPWYKYIRMEPQWKAFIISGIVSLISLGLSFILPSGTWVWAFSLGITVAGFFVTVGSLALSICVLFEINLRAERHRADLISYAQSLVYQCACGMLCDEFSITQEQFDFDITPILNQHVNLRQTWFLSDPGIDVVRNALAQKYKRMTHEMQLNDLKIENMQLQNEGLAIDNIQKKNWRCGSCGNLNRADDMSCINCGAIRPED